MNPKPNLDQHNQLAVVRMKRASQILGLQRGALYDRWNPKSPRFDPTFPRPIRLNGSASSKGAIGLIESELQVWIEDRMNEATTHRVADSKLSTRVSGNGLSKGAGK